jgi:uncharacterized protein (DUF2141 family)
LAALAVLGASASSAAATPALTITHPLGGSSTNATTPPVGGTTEDALDPITLKIYSGPNIEGSLVQSSTIAAPFAESWDTTAETLADGEYTAIAEQTNLLEPTKSAEVTFSVDTTQPAVSLSYVPTPGNDATPTLTGAAGTETGDHGSVLVTIYKGSSVGGAEAASQNVSVSGSSWSYTAPHLEDGTYTAQAAQGDNAGNTGMSSAVTFTVDTTSPSVALDTVASPGKDSTPTLTGAAGTEPGDAGTVTVKILSGKTPIASTVASVSAGGWSWVAPHLSDGSYNAVVEQSDEAGNTATKSSPVFIIDTTAPNVSLNSLPSLINSSTPSFAGGGGGASGDSGTVTLTIYAGSSPGGTIVQTLHPKVSSGSWSAGPAATLVDGTYTAVAEQSDEAGNTGTGNPSTFTVDTVAPLVTLNALASLGNSATPTFTGDAGTADQDSAAVTVKIYKGMSASGSPAQTLVTGASGATWSATPGAGLADGVYTAIAQQSDQAGNTGSSSTSTFTIDTTAPKVTLKPVQALSKVTTPTFAGGAGGALYDLPSVTLDVYAGASATGLPVATLSVEASGGAWAAASIIGLGDGTYTALARQADEAGNTGFSSPSTFTVDTTPPSVTLNSLPALVNTATPTFSGGAGAEQHDNPVVTIRIYEGATASGTPTQTLLAKPVGGSWAAAPAKALAEGQYTAVAEQSDEAGNVTVASATTFTVNTALPKVTLKALAAISKATLPTFSGGAGTALHDLPTVTVRIYPGTAPAGSPVQTLLTKASGASWAVGASSALADGTYTAIAEQSNEAAQTGQSIPSTFTVDTKAPAVTINAVASLSRNATPALGGTGGSLAEHSLPAVTVKVYAGGAATGVPVQTLGAEASGHLWGVTAAKLADGTYTAIAEQSDEAGNTGISGTTTFTVDTAAPKVTLNHLAELVGDATPTFGGGAGSAPLDGHVVTLKIYEGTGASGKLAQTLLAEASGGTWTATPTTPLPDGTYTAIAEQSDEAGNTGKSTTTTFVVDTVAPKVTLHPLAPILGSPTPTFNGNAGTALHDVQTVALRIYLGTTPTGKVVQSVETKASEGAWSAKPKALADGTYTAVAEQRDEAGNTGRSGGTTFTVKTKGPNVTLAAIHSPTNSATPTFTGGAGTPAEHDLPTVTVKVYAGTAANGTPVETLATEASAGSWAVTATKPLSDGSYTAVAEQTDTTENVGKSVASPFTVDATQPQLTLSEPVNGSVTTSSSQLISGTAGSEAGDSEQVTVQLYAGSAAGGAPIENHAVATSGASRSWSTTFAGLSPGTYTVRAVQLDEAGNLGASPPSTFTVSSPPPPPPPPPTPAAAAKPPPVAYFTWVPSSPHVGETVTLVSNSSDGVEAIASLAWAAAGDGKFTPGGPLITTTFAKPGAYPVQLRVTSAAGLSSVVSRTIPVTSVPTPLMQPFPVVRIVGYDTASGVNLRLLSVMSPVNARVTISCRGKGCPTRAESHVASAGGSTRKSGSVLVNFRRFARAIPAGVTLQIRVAKVGQIGKYTRFTVRRGKLPTRVDSCLDPTGVTPISCPSR